MKKIVLFALVLSLVFALVACGGTTTPPAATEAPAAPADEPAAPADEPAAPAGEGG